MKRAIIIFILCFFQPLLYGQKPNLNGFYKLNFGISEEYAKNIIENEPDGDNFKCSCKPMDGGLKWFCTYFANRMLVNEDRNEFTPSIQLYFHNNQFYSAIVPISGNRYVYNEIQSEITEKYFPCDISEGWWQCKWIFNGGDYIELKYTETDALVGKAGKIMLTYVKILLSDLKKSEKIKGNLKYY